MPEALEKWPVKVVRELLPRVMAIIDEIDNRWNASMQVLSMFPCSIDGG